MRTVCDRIANGELVRYVAQDLNVDERRIREWGESDEFAPLYTRARIAQAHAIAEHAIAIADGEDAVTATYEAAIDAEQERLIDADNKHVGKIIGALRANLLNRDRMRMDARKWMASKLAPKMYGERQQVDMKQDGPFEVTVTFKHEQRKATAG